MLCRGSRGVRIGCGKRKVKMSSMVPWRGGRSAFEPFSLAVLDPFDASAGGFLWDHPSWRLDERDGTAAIARTKVDWTETPSAHMFRADLPGVTRDEVRVHVGDGNVLQISGERTTKEETDTNTWHRVERRRGSFHRRFRLPENADMDAVQGSLDHGVLTVSVPKKGESEKPARNTRAIGIM